MTIGTTLLLSLAAPAAVAVARAGVEFIKDFLKKNGTRVEIHTGNQKFSIVISEKNKAKSTEIIAQAIHDHRADTQI